MKGQRREKSPSWKGGRYISNGYVRLLKPEHPRADCKGYIHEHILLAEKALGKPLPKGTEIHHYGLRSNNTKIVICENGKYHKLLHIRTDALIACGNVNYRKCNICKEYDNPKNLYIREMKAGGWDIYHRECKNKYNRNRRKKLFVESVAPVEMPFVVLRCYGG